MIKVNSIDDCSTNNDNEITDENNVFNLEKSKNRLEKRGWFISLSRRRKFQNQSKSQNSSSSSSVSELSHQHRREYNTNKDSSFEKDTIFGNDERISGTFADNFNLPVPQQKSIEEKTVFQRIKKKIGIHFLHRQNKVIANTTTTINDSNTEEPDETLISLQKRQEIANIKHLAQLYSTELTPFTHHFRNYIAKKWLERESGPNKVMYKACFEMLSQVWYWGEIARRDAQKQLTDKPTGSFLVRDSETSGSKFTLSFRIVNVTLHYRLEHRGGYWHFEELQYESIVEMIDNILHRCTNENFVCFVKVANEMQPPFPVILKYPLSRYLQMPTLQNLCRCVIQRHINLGKISILPIPPKLQEYLSEQRGLVFHS